MLTRFGGEVVDTFAFPTFKENFSSDEGKIVTEILKSEILSKLAQFENQLK
jgi:hypothetical protein